MSVDNLIVGALFDFLGYLTTRPEVRRIGSGANAAPFCDDLADFLKERGVPMDEPWVKDWQDRRTTFLKNIDIIVNGETHTVESDIVGYEQIVQFVTGIVSPARQNLTVVFYNGHTPIDGVLRPGQTVKVVNRTVFSAVDTGRA